MRKALSGLLLAAAIGAGAAPAAAIESGMCRWNDVQAACTYCSYEGSATMAHVANCKSETYVPGHAWQLCLVWFEVRCLVKV